MVETQPIDPVENSGLLAALDGIPYGFALVAGDGTLTFANRAFRTLCQIADDDTAAGTLALAMDAQGRPLSQSLADAKDGREVGLPGGWVRLDAARLGDGAWSVTLAPRAEYLRAEARAKRAQKVALVALADLAEYRDGDTGEHVLRVARMTHEIARTLKQGGVYADICDSAFLQHIGIASILHDVGKVGVPDAVLLKPAKLTPEERQVMERHPSTGGAILKKAERLLAGSLHFRLAGEISDGHHECWDGGGYPRHLAGEDIPLAARIVAVADVFDALTSRRPYKQPWREDDAVAFIRERSGKQFDPAVVDAFLDVLALRKRAAAVAWSDQIAIGHEAIDHDHKILLALINQISAPENRQDLAAVEFVLDELVSYTNSHFAREEEIMAAAGYPNLERHKEIHRALLDDVADMQSRFSDHGSVELGDELSQFLSMWLINHIMHEDRQYRPYVVPGAQME